MAARVPNDKLESVMSAASQSATTAGSAMTSLRGNVEWSAKDIASFCGRWQITRLGVFGSVLRPDFGAASDVDVLARFSEAAQHSLLDLERMEHELGSILGREVDLLSWWAVERSKNRFRREAILGSVKTLYES